MSARTRYHFPQKPKEVCIATYEEELERRRNNKKRGRPVVPKVDEVEDEERSQITLRVNEIGNFSITWNK